MRIVSNISPHELRNQGYWISDEVISIARVLAGKNENQSNNFPFESCEINQIITIRRGVLPC